jgi:hypothetical protein
MKNVSSKIALTGLILAGGTVQIPAMAMSDQNVWSFKEGYAALQTVGLGYLTATGKNTTLPQAALALSPTIIGSLIALGIKQCSPEQKESINKKIDAIRGKIPSKIKLALACFTPEFYFQRVNHSSSAGAIGYGAGVFARLILNIPQLAQLYGFGYLAGKGQEATSLQIKMALSPIIVTATTVATAIAGVAVYDYLSRSRYKYDEDDED